MFDFTSLVETQGGEVPASLVELFKQLDRKTTHTSLRPAQVAALTALDLQLAQHDVIMKLSTGSGKTMLGLVYAEMMRRKYKGEPVVYLCPTNQLIEQVVATGQAIGVTVSTFEKTGLPYSAMSGDTVLACTYDRLFTSNTVFESKSIRPSAIVLDDVHAGIERVRKYFTVQVPMECLDRLKNLLKPLCESTDAPTWAGIINNDFDATYEVPFWIWSQVCGEVVRLIAPHRDEPPLLFTWGNIARYIELARCCISGTSAEITLQIPPIEEVPAYAGAKHRLFMSASIKDISGLIGVLGCDADACARLIEPTEDEGAGERMILPTSLIDPTSKKPEIAAACALLAKQTNVVVLTTSAAQAKAWTNAGAVLSQDKDFNGALEKLRTSIGNYVVFAQRFDGVDLPDDACRILVIDGIPSGERITDQVDSYRQKDSPEYEVRTVNKFEQALGRAVRSSADYAAVLLVGADIAAFIGRKDVAGLLEGRTRLQLELGRKLAQKASGTKPITGVIAEMAQALLSRNEGWKEAHRAQVKTQDKQLRANSLTPFESAAVAMRGAWNMAKAKNYQAAVTQLREATNTLQLHPVQKAELMYWVATYLHQFNPAQATDAYKAVFTANTKFPRPPQVADRKFARLTDQALAVCQAFSGFASANAALARLDEVTTKLSYGNSAETVERGLHELGQLLGATSSRPEKETGRGPDVLWLFDNCGACIEAKSEKSAPIHKSDAAQLVLSTQWCDDSLAAGTPKPVPVFATNVATADRPEDIAFGPHLLNEEMLMTIVENLRKVLLSLTYDGPLFTDPATVAKRLSEVNLTGAQIIQSLPTIKP
ncbi:helicase C-terminal domain-containing protein [Ralstonia pseudosolanacearum]|uniref:helicase C-terminal domain-containing protein n=1 Tax=Ralstonia pseudosolanacearum TaxID=1310165 RepID=UPI0014328B69|nr:P-loop containing nucleoside triphosphate hydrolase [Ralstonia solanacearum]NKF93652.1 P-loop containing nucleoside triphosphate hydrolase [Ralstonia solanacearum]NKG11046.1 P-loop containing nucleoside triphosphate hydrolase [Ralstonia solanacearum]